MKTNYILATMLFSVMALGCKKSSSDDKTTTTTATTVVDANVPTIYKKVYGATSITSDGTYVYIKSTGTPDHKSVYYPTTNSLYESFSGTTFAGNTFSKN